MELYLVSWVEYFLAIFFLSLIEATQERIIAIEGFVPTKEKYMKLTNTVIDTIWERRLFSVIVDDVLVLKNVFFTCHFFYLPI